MFIRIVAEGHVTYTNVASWSFVWYVLDPLGPNWRQNGRSFWKQGKTPSVQFNNSYKMQGTKFWALHLEDLLVLTLYGGTGCQGGWNKRDRCLFHKHKNDKETIFGVKTIKTSFISANFPIWRPVRYFPIWRSVRIFIIWTVIFYGDVGYNALF